MPILNKKKSNACSQLSMAIQWVVMVLLLLTSIAAALGVWNTHAGADAFAFGTSGGSLALLAFAVNVTLWKKTARCLCGSCEVK